MKSLSNIARILGILAGLLGTARAETAVTATPPAGYFKLTAAGSGDTWLSVPLVARSAGLARVAAVGASTVTLRLEVAGTPPADHAYRPAGAAVYYTQFVSGPLEGLAYPITDNQGAVLALDTLGDSLTEHPLGAVAVGEGGDRVRIRAAWTVAGLFGHDTADLLVEPVTTLAPFVYGLEGGGDSVLFPDNLTGGVEKLPAPVLAYVNGSGWRERGAGESEADASATPLWPGRAFILRRASTEPLEAVVIGYVATERAVVRLPALAADEERDVAIAWLPPVGRSLVDSSLADVTAASPSALQLQDELLGFSGERPGFSLPPVHRWHQVGGQWFESETSADAQLLEAGTGYLLRLRGERGVRYWQQPFLAPTPAPAATP